MCGIFGAIALKSALNPQLCREAASYIAARGPDFLGHTSSSHGIISAELYHSRLSVIDPVESSNQPMHDDCGEWVIVYNGEVYNYLEIRAELVALGCAFKTQSDTEVLLKAWSQWGVECLPRLNGMFAFGVFNKTANELWLVRDRFGVKPLLWGSVEKGQGLVFSSSVSAVARYVNADVSIAYCAFGAHYKAFESAEHAAPFVGVETVPPGGWLKVTFQVDKLIVEKGQWYDLPTAVSYMSGAIEQLSDEELLQRCEHLLIDSIKLRLRSDVPLAVSLSGGLDSSTIAAVAAKFCPELHGFTYGSSADSRSEGPVVSQFCMASGLNPHYIWPKFNAIELDQLLERTLVRQEAPFPSLSVIAQNEVFRVVRQTGFKVLLGGQGGDEIFAGYRKFFFVAVRHALFNRDAPNAMRLLYSCGRMLMHEIRSAGVYWENMGRYSSRGGNSFNVLNWEVPSANLLGRPETSLCDRQIEDVSRWSIPTLLRYEDRNSMGYGVESRLPYMDYRLVELALALPTRLKIKNGFGKWALRHVGRDVVPDFIRLNRQKRGFDVTQTWIDDGLGDSLRMRIRSNLPNLAPHLKKHFKVDRDFSNAALSRDGNLLDEALMLAWLAEPLRNPATPEGYS